MNIAYMYVLLMLSVVSLYSADKDMQLSPYAKTCPHIIVHEGTPAVHTDIYNKLLSISRTLQEQVNDFGTPVSLTNKLYYPVNCKPMVLKHITNYITAQNTDTYLSTLSLLELVHLYQEADFWAVDTNILDTIRNCIVDQLRNADTLTWLLSSKENLSHFITACNPVTLDTLTRALHSYTSNMLWYTTQILTGHTKWINSVAVHTDGTLISGSGDKTVRVWKPDAQGTYHCVQILTGHTDSIISLAVHTDGTLFSCSFDDTIRIWRKDAQGTYHCVQISTGHDNWRITTVAVHTDGILFSGSNDATIRVWKQDAQGTYHCVQTLTGYHKSDYINAVAVCTDGTLLSGSGDGTICVWKKDAQGTYRCVQALTDHTGAISTVAVHTDGTLFSCSIDCIVRVWKPDSQGIYYCVQTLTGHTSWIKKVTIRTDGTLFSCSGNDGKIRIYKTDAQGAYERIQTLTAHTILINTLVAHPDGTLLSGSSNTTMRVWKTLEEHLSLEQHLLLHWLCTTYQSNGNTQLNTLTANMIDIYHTLPQSIKDHIIQWYKLECVSDHSSTNTNPFLL